MVDNLKLCLKTGMAHGGGLQRRTCRHCKSAYARQYRANGYKERPRTLPKNQYTAKLAVFNAVRRGALPQISTQICVDCSDQASVYEHRDYLKPLDVQPVCHRCNKRRGPASNLHEVCA